MVLIGQPVVVSVGNLTPDSIVSLRATTLDRSGHVWRAQAEFRAEQDGSVVLTDERPLSGAYRLTDGMGLFWAMRQVGSHLAADEQRLTPAPLSVVRIRASSGGRSATASLVRRTQARKRRLLVTTLKSQGFRGCFYRGRRTARTPAIMIIADQPGLACGPPASLLASYGYPTLAIAYYGAPGLPPKLQRIPLEYFRHALIWLRHQPGIVDHQLIVFGISQGAEAALLLAAEYPMLIHGAISYVGRSTIASPPTPAQAIWTLHGTPVRFTHTRANSKPRPATPRTEIPVEKISGPILLVSAGNDKLWPSAADANAIISRLRKHHHHNDTSLSYPQAGHGIASVLPSLPAPTTILTSRGPIHLGGNPTADALARNDAWTKLLAFLRQT
jgi:dienelactone hydrolase